MIIGVKRPPVIEELHDPHLSKRYRLDTSLDLHPWASADDVLAAVASASGATRARSSLDDVPSPPPPEKRLRLNSPSLERSPAGEDCTALEGGGGGRHDDNSAETSIREWAEVVVKALHGCPSVDEAAQRCREVLARFGAEVREQVALREAEASREAAAARAAQAQPSSEDERTTEGSQGATARVLMRAVHHLADRCRRLEAGNSETEMLRQALEQSQEAQKRLQHSNEVLQAHLRLHFGDCTDGLVPWGHALH